MVFLSPIYVETIISETEHTLSTKRGKEKHVLQHQKMIQRVFFCMSVYFTDKKTNWIKMFRAGVDFDLFAKEEHSLKSTKWPGARLSQQNATALYPMYKSRIGKGGVSWLRPLAEKSNDRKGVPPMMNVGISESFAVREDREENIEVTQVQKDVANLVYELRDTCGREFRITKTELDCYRDMITLEIRGVRVLEMWEVHWNSWSLHWYGSSRDEDLVYLYLILYPALDWEL